MNLQSSKSGTIGVIIPNISNSFFARVLSGIEEEAQKEGLKVITYISNESLKREQEITWLLSSGFVDGVLVAFSEEAQRNKEFTHLFNLIEYDIPVVLYDRIGFDFQVDKIGINDEQSLCEATKFFISQEVLKIGLASAIPNLDVGKLRIRAIKRQ
jgi:LacI family transcriptional regulator